MTVFGHEKGRGDLVARPFDLFPYPEAGCPTSITEINFDGDAVKVSRHEPKFKAAVVLLHGDGHETSQSFRT